MQASKKMREYFWVMVFGNQSYEAKIHRNTLAHYSLDYKYPRLTLKH